MGLWAIFVPLLLSIVSESAVSRDDCLIGISGIDGGAGSTLREGQTLVSSGGRFVLGFFSPGGSSGRRYLGVRYRNIPSPAIWVANRDRPIAGAGVLVLTAAGVLALRDSTGVIWRVGPGKPAGRPVLQILDSGNLVLGDLAGGEVSEYTWQSFDHPCNVLIPGMKLGWDPKMGRHRNMTSWRSPEDPAAGDLTLSLDHPELPQLVLRFGSEMANRWGPLDRPNFNGPMTNPDFKQVLVSSREEVYYTISASDESVPVMMELTSTALISFLTWSNRTKNWVEIATLPNDSCDKYGTCGPNGYCYYYDHDHESDCQCLEGFVPEKQNDWELDHRTGGCVRRWRLGNGNGDRFVRFSGLKLPDGSCLADGNKNWSRRECELECLVNSSCTAYTVMNLLYPIGSGCVTWFGDLVDTRSSAIGGHDFYVRMAQEEIDSINQVERTRQIEITLLIVMSLCCVMCILTVIGLKMIIVGNESRKAREERIVPINIEHERHDGEAINEESIDLLPLYDLATLSVATNQFSSDNKIGQGGFGFVYKGVLPNGQEIAVKRLSRSSSHGLQQFKNEVILVSKLQHRNLVKLLGCCIQGEERMLVYEYLSNKSLDNFLFGHSRSNILTWDTRYNIILGIARGLLYLHEDSRLRIIHRDLKTSNILLDSDMTPKISDFGIASIFGGDQTEERTRRVLGTYGYMSPEYAIRGHFSIKSDVFSFGVLLLEVISGTHNWSFHHPDHDSNLLGHAWKLWSEGNALELVDPFMEGSFCVEEVMRCIQVGLLCVQQGIDDRPMISSVIFMLSNEIAAIPHPKEPGFFSGASYSGTHEYVEAWSGGQNICTTELTVSDIQGR